MANNHNWIGQSYDSLSEPAVIAQRADQTEFKPASDMEKPTQPLNPALSEKLTEEFVEHVIEPVTSETPSIPRWQQPFIAKPEVFLAGRGWRKFFNLFGCKFKESPAERAHRLDGYDIQYNPSDMLVVLVAQPKGGAGKTPLSQGIGLALRYYGNHQVVIWDNNEANATLTFRCGVSPKTPTAWDLAQNAHRFFTHEYGVAQLKSFMASHKSGLVDLLASPGDVDKVASLDRKRVEELIKVLSTGYQISVVDSGNSVSAPNFLAVMAKANVVIVPLDISEVTCDTTKRLIHHIHECEREDLFIQKKIIFVVTNRSKLANKDFEKYLSSFAPVFHLNHDPHIAQDSTIYWDKLSKQTRETLFHVGAQIMRCTQN